MHGLCFRTQKREAGTALSRWSFLVRFWVGHAGKETCPPSFWESWGAVLSASSRGAPGPADGTSGRALACTRFPTAFLVCAVASGTHTGKVLALRKGAAPEVLVLAKVCWEGSRQERPPQALPSAGAGLQSALRLAGHQESPVQWALTWSAPAGHLFPGSSAESFLDEFSGSVSSPSGT